MDQWLDNEVQNFSFDFVLWSLLYFYGWLLENLLDRCQYKCDQNLFVTLIVKSATYFILIGREARQTITFLH